MKNKSVRKEEKTYSLKGLIILWVLSIAIGIGLFFLLRYLLGLNKDDSGQKEPDTSENVSVEYNNLLKLLNAEITATSLIENEKANNVVSISFTDNYFYISGVNETYAYDYKIDLTSKGYSSIKEAYDFVKYGNVGNEFAKELTRWSIADKTSFETKFVTEGITGKYMVGEITSNTVVYATLKSGDNKISIIHGDQLNDVLNESYSAKIVDLNDPLFQIYSYIVSI